MAKFSSSKAFYAIAVLVSLFGATAGHPRPSGQKRLVIHVPVQVKMHHHTHTVYSHIRSGETKQTVYKILGYSSYGKGHSEHSGHSIGGGSDGGGGGDGSLIESGHDDCCDNNNEHDHDYDETSHHYSRGHTSAAYSREPSRSHGDMIFNHYSRKNDDLVEEFPVMETFADDVIWESNE